VHSEDALGDNSRRKKARSAGKPAKVRTAAPAMQYPTRSRVPQSSEEKKC
jgi:hypothetical protein